MKSRTNRYNKNKNSKGGKPNNKTMKQKPKYTHLVDNSINGIGEKGKEDDGPVIIPMNCNPVVDDKTPVLNSCYTAEALNEIKNAYNKNTENEIKITATEPKYIWLDLRKRLDHCSREDCWLNEIKNPDTRRQYDEIMFAPDRPNEWNQDPVAWLSNYDIAAVLKQYEKSHPDFKLLGPSAIDYDTQLNDGKCVWNDLCRLSLNELQDQGKRKLGVVFNLDKHYQPGSHWVSLFVDLDKQIIFYYDSAMNPVPREVSRLKNEIIKQGKSLNTPINFKYMLNNYSHQMSNTECGMFCLFFIITWLTEEIDNMVSKKHVSKIIGGKSTKLSTDALIKLFTKPGITDEMMIMYRNILFNKK